LTVRFGSVKVDLSALHSVYKQGFAITNDLKNAILLDTRVPVGPIIASASMVTIHTPDDEVEFATSTRAWDRKLVAEFAKRGIHSELNH